jgi:ribonucleoside-diphosphate reductase alpha chain
MTKLADAVRTAVEMLDNVINLNFYPSEEARNSNLRHRPIGLGVMGYAEALNMCGIDYESQEHLEWAHAVFECISFNAILMSCELAQERGAYESFNGSLWSKGILTPKTAKDSAKALVEATISEEDWNWLSELVTKHGLRNCNLLAIAPTATIANIAGTTACTELPIQPSYLKSNLSGSFKFVDPSLRHNPERCRYAYSIDQEWAIRAAAVRQIFIDQAQSLNLFKAKDIKGREVLEWYLLAWRLGLKSTYYLKNQKKNSDAKKAGENNV